MNHARTVRRGVPPHACSENCSNLTSTGWRLASAHSKSSVDGTSLTARSDPIGSSGADKDCAIVDEFTKWTFSVHPVLVPPDWSCYDMAVHRQGQSGSRVVAAEFAQHRAQFGVCGTASSEVFWDEGSRYSGIA